MERFPKADNISKRIILSEMWEIEKS